MLRARFDRLHWKLGAAVTVLVTAGLLGTVYLTYQVYRQHYVSALSDRAGAEASLIRAALEHGMLRKGDDTELLQRLVTAFASDRVERVMVLDHGGRVAVSSDPAQLGHRFDKRDDACAVCHDAAPRERSRDAMIELDGGTVLRSVQPIPNREACHECHDPAQAINGKLIVDTPIGDRLDGLSAAVETVGLAAVLLGLLVLGSLGWVIRRLVLRRLARFERTARAIGAGDLDQRVPVEGNDGLTHLELEFNAMTDSMVALLNQVQEQQASLLKVMNAVDDGVVVLDPQLKVVAANDAFARRFGPDGRAAALAGLACATEIGLGGCQRHSHGECPALGCFADGEGRTVLRARTTWDGATRSDEVRVSPVRGADGKVTQVVEVWRDITNRRSAEARAADYQRLASLGMLASGFSHEVNTPLSSIDTCLSAIERAIGRASDAAAADCGPLLEYARVAREQVERCGTITRQFLQLARGNALSREVIDLPEAADVVRRLIAPTARDAGIEVAIEPPSAGLPVVLANRAAVQQVLLNLTLNAVHASDEGQTVTLAFELTDDAVEIKVSDAGTGIPAEDVGRIFEPFFSRRPGGVGLGLFVSQGFAHGWGGRLHLIASTPGEGTTFGVIFPRAPVHATAGESAGSDTQLGAA